MSAFWLCTLLKRCLKSYASGTNVVDFCIGFWFYVVSPDWCTLHQKHELTGNEAFANCAHSVRQIVMNVKHTADGLANNNSIHWFFAGTRSLRDQA